MASVRGIGVAVMISWCGSRPACAPFSESRSRCCTPKRCCSSTMTSARRANSMPSWNSACVPTTRRISPAAIAASALRRVRAGWPPDSSATGLAERGEPVAEVAPVLLGEQLGRRHERRLRTAARGARRGQAATTVLPQPTSPCSSRTIGTLPARSRSASPSTRACAAVSVNGSDARSRRARAASSGQRRGGIGLQRALAQLQRQGVRQQLLEGEPPLRRMAAGGELGELRAARRRCR